MWRNSTERNFGLWQVKVQDPFVQQGLHKAPKGKIKKPTDMKDDDWEDLDLRATSAICLCVADDVVYSIVDVSLAREFWKKLKGLYMKKSLKKQLYLKQ